MEEKRRAKRIKKSLYVQCRLYDTSGPWLSAIVQDLSVGGMRISMPKEFDKGEILDIKISTFLTSQRINILGKVMSCEKKGNKGLIRILRIAFTHVDKEAKMLLQEFTQIFSDNGKLQSEKIKEVTK